MIHWSSTWSSRMPLHCLVLFCFVFFNWLLFGLLQSCFFCTWGKNFFFQSLFCFLGIFSVLLFFPVDFLFLEVFLSVMFRAVKTLIASVRLLSTWWNGDKQDLLCFGFEALGALKKKRKKKQTKISENCFFSCECGTLLWVLVCQMLR